MEAPRLVTPEERETLAANRRAFDERLEEIREVSRERANETVIREQGSAVIRIAAQGD